MSSTDKAHYQQVETAVLALAAVICPQAAPVKGWPAMATVSCQLCRDRAAAIVRKSFGNPTRHNAGRDSR